MKKIVALLVMIPFFAKAAELASINAGEVSRAELNDHKSVATKYEGVELVVTGVLQKHDKYDDGYPMEIVGSDSLAYFSILTFVPEDKTRAEKVKIGSKIRARCVGDFQNGAAFKQCRLLP
ncbi:hypothetical protein [Burkholderia stagnalis]|uniref:hypothetical protein n=1 Tax=Burkholderia stagnalis TaxID=1503054 RepID=UPI000F80B1D0|nr:hypothetical protein [Burkholderia stagnalis]